MRFELMIFVCMACLALAAQAAPAAGKDALLEQELGHQSSGKQQHSKHHSKHHPTRRHHQQQRHSQQHISNHHGHAPGPRKRGPPLEGEIQEATEAAERLMPGMRSTSDLNPDIEAALRAEIAKKQKAARDRAEVRMHTMQVKDALHVGKYGQTPPKFPLITRISAIIGLSAAAVNVVNFMISAKTTALATTQFSAPPTPPTLLDTPALWDGQQYRLLPLPEDADSKESVGSSKKAKRSLVETNELSASAHTRLIKRRKPSITREYDSPVQTQPRDHQVAKKDKRWLTASLVGGAVGAAFAPGLTSTIFPRLRTEPDKPPFNPYDPKMLQPQDAFLAAAADPDKPLPVLQTVGVAGGGYGQPMPSEFKFPSSAYSVPATTNNQPSPSVGYPVRHDLAPGVENTYDGSVSMDSTPTESHPILRKRSVAPAQHADAVENADQRASKLDKRFLFGGGTMGKVAGAVTVGSVIPLLYGGIEHARFRTENPRDRDILKDLEQRPTFGAVGVPNLVPGQVATNGMPGYAQYIANLKAQQAQQQMQIRLVQLQQSLAQRQAQIQQAQQSQIAQSASDATGTGSEAGSSAAAEPILRKRGVEDLSDCPDGASGHEGRRHLSKRGNWLLGGAMLAFGGALGYFQTATQFPTDRDEEKDAKKRERQKEQEQWMAQMQMQAQMQGGQPPGYSPTDASAMGGGMQSDMLAGVPGQPLSAATAGNGLPSLGGGLSSPPMGGGSSVYGGGASLPSLGSGSSNSVYPSASGNPSYSGGAASTSAMINSAAGYQNSGGSETSNDMLKKRDTSGSRKLGSRRLSKRSPGFGDALAVGSTFMFGGTLLGNLYVSSKQKDKPVPLVTPNPNTLGPMIPGGDLYPAYLEAKRAQAGGLTASGAGMAPIGAPASMPYPGLMRPLPQPQPQAQDVTNSLNTDTGIGTGTRLNADAGAGTLPSYGGSNVNQEAVEPDNALPVLKKRALAAFGAAAEAETSAAALLRAAPALSEATAGATSLLTKAPAISEAASGAASASRLGAISEAENGVASAGRLGRLSPLGGTTAGLTRTEAGLTGLGRASRLAEGESAGAFSAMQADRAMLGTARPAMISNPRAAGGAGTPATIEDLAGRSSGRYTPSPLPNGYGRSSLQDMLQAEQRAATGGVTAAPNAAVGDALAGPQKATGKQKMMEMVNMVGTGAGATMMFSGIG